MTMLPLGGLIGSAAGAPLSQTKGSDTERAQKDTLTQSREADAALQAERAGGIGETAEDQESSERDADGRRLWERPPGGKNPLGSEPENASARQGKDATGQAGSQLDLTG